MSDNWVKTLAPALRQYRHQTEDKFVCAYDCEISEEIVAEMEAEIDQLRAEIVDLKNALYECEQGEK